MSAKLVDLLKAEADAVASESAADSKRKLAQAKAANLVETHKTELTEAEAEALSLIDEADSAAVAARAAKSAARAAIHDLLASTGDHFIRASDGTVSVYRATQDAYTVLQPAAGE